MWDSTDRRTDTGTDTSGDREQTWLQRHRLRAAFVSIVTHSGVPFGPGQRGVKVEAAVSWEMAAQPVLDRNRQAL